LASPKSAESGRQCLERQCLEWIGVVLWRNRTKQWNRRVRVDVARVKDVRQRIIDLAMLKKPYKAFLAFGDVVGLLPLENFGIVQKMTDARSDGSAKSQGDSYDER
jgi:hypothetical protein